MVGIDEDLVEVGGVLDDFVYFLDLASRPAVVVSPELLVLLIIFALNHLNLDFMLAILAA